MNASGCSIWRPPRAYLYAPGGNSASCSSKLQANHPTKRFVSSHYHGVGVQSTKPHKAEYGQFFRYSSGRWLWGEEEQLKARFRRLDVEELQRVAAQSVGAKNCLSITKVGEGGHNKVFRIVTEDGPAVIARIPNPNAGPPFFTTASEVAKMDFIALLQVERYWKDMGLNPPCPIHFTRDEVNRHLEEAESWNKVQDFFDSIQGLVQRDGWTNHETYDEALAFFAELRRIGLKEMREKEREWFKPRTSWVES